MDEVLAMFLSGQHEFTARVHAIKEDQWAAPTPDTEWSVADLVNHLIDEHRWAPPLLRGLDLDAAGKVVEGSRSLPVDGGVGANLAELWDEAAAGSADAVTADGAIDRSVELSRGTTPARTYLAEMVFDLTVHSWDLGKAIGYDELLPRELVEFVRGNMPGTGDLSGSGLFAKPVEVREGASPQEQVIAATGRDPSWSSPSR
jgi:uncharacterized protein (TIGR03086 family)